MNCSTRSILAALVTFACAGTLCAQDAAAPIRRSSPSPTPTATPEEQREEPTPLRAEAVATPQPAARPPAPETTPPRAEAERPQPAQTERAEPKPTPAATAPAAATPRRIIQEQPVRAVEPRPRSARPTTPPPSAEPKPGSESTGAPRPSVTDWSTRASRPTFDLSSDGFGQIAATIRSLEKKWQRAIQRGDVDVIEELLADDFVGTSSNGRTASKSTMLATLRRDKNVYKTARVSGMSVRNPSPAVAVVTGIATETGVTPDGKNFRASRRFTDTWVERGGRWRCVASHTTQAPDA